MSDSKILMNKKIVITGATNKTGSTIAKLLSEQGANLVLISRNKVELEFLESELGECHKYICYDLTECNGIANLVTNMFAGTKFDGLIHCANVGYFSPLEFCESDRLKEHLAVNLYAFIELIRQMSKKKYMNSGSRIIGISSIAAEKIQAGQLAYASSKAAMDVSVIVLAKELCKRSITINTIRPAILDSNFGSGYLKNIPSDDFEQLLSTQTLGIIEPQSIANSVLLLFSISGRYITGRNINIYAGM